MNDAFIAISVLLGLFAVIYAIGKWILGPIDRAARERRAPVRFAISDFLCLFVVVQLPLTLISRSRSEDTETLFWAFTILAWIVAPMIWVSCAVALSRAGITSGKHRFIFMGVVLPIVYYGLIPFMLMALFAIGTLWSGHGNELAKYWWLSIVWVLLGAGLAGCGIFTNRLIRSTGVASISEEPRPRSPES